MTDAPSSHDYLTPGERFVTGQRYVVRRRLDDAEISASAQAGDGFTLTDVVGEVTALDDHHVVLHTRRGDDVQVPLSQIALSKPLPPAPERRPRR